jgi:uncharacterized protein YdbL (DUF1318 family)
MKARVILLCLISVAVIACITINVYFPEAAIKDLSEQIEEEVARQAGAETAATEPTPTPLPEVDTQSQVWFHSELPATGGFSLFGGSVAWAQDVPAPEVSNPAIRRIIDSRAARLEALNGLKARGIVGENNQALVEVRSLDGVTDLRERAQVQRLVKDENADREQLFKEIAAAKNVDLSQLPRVRETYAATIRSKARKGDWIQLPDGTWTQK